MLKTIRNSRFFKKADEYNDQVADWMIEKFISMTQWCFRPGSPLGFAHNYSRLFQVLILGSIVVAIVVGSSIFPESASDIDSKHVLYISMCVALGSFLYTNYSSAKSEKKRMTVDFVFSTRQKGEYQNAVSVLQKCTPWITQDKITWEQYNQWSKAGSMSSSEISDSTKEEFEYYRAIQYMLNYYEFVSAAICTDSLDEELVHRMMRGFLINLVNKTEDIIGSLRTPNGKLNPSTGALVKNYDSGKQLCHLVYVFETWNEEQQELELGPSPLPFVFRKQVTSDASFRLKVRYKDWETYNAYCAKKVKKTIETLSEEAKQELSDIERSDINYALSQEGGFNPDNINYTESPELVKKLKLDTFDSWKSRV